LNDTRSPQNQATTDKTSKKNLHKEAYKLEKKSSKTNAKSTHKKPTNRQNHERNRDNNRFQIKSPKKSRQIGQNGQAIAYNRSPKEQAKSGKNKLSENAEKKPIKVETNHQNRDSKSEMQLLLQPNAAQNRQKSTKTTENTGKNTPNAAQIAAYITAFIAIKLGEGRV
jgi:hypothetical protein